MQQRRRAHDQRVGAADDPHIPVLIRDPGQDVPHRLQPGPLLVVALHHGPGRVGQVGVEEHRLLGLGVLVPLVERGQIDRAQFPALDRVELAADEPPELLGPGHREPELDQGDPVPGQHPLELRRLAQELHDLIRPAEPHHPLDAGPVVPGPVEHRDLARCGQASYVPLQVPLGPLALGRPVQGHHVRPARVQILGEPPDRPALARRVAALEQDDEAALLCPDRALQFEHLDLEQALGLLVLSAAQLLGVGIVLTPGLDALALRPGQGHLSVLLVADGQAKLLGEAFQGRVGRSVPLSAGHQRGPRFALASEHPANKPVDTLAPAGHTWVGWCWHSVPTVFARGSRGSRGARILLARRSFRAAGARGRRAESRAESRAGGRVPGVGGSAGTGLKEPGVGVGAAGRRPRSRVRPVRSAGRQPPRT